MNISRFLRTFCRMSGTKSSRQKKALQRRKYTGRKMTVRKICPGSPSAAHSLSQKKKKNGLLAGDRISPCRLKFLTVLNEPLRMLCFSLLPGAFSEKRFFNHKIEHQTDQQPVSGAV